MKKQKSQGKRQGRELKKRTQRKLELAHRQSAQRSAAVADRPDSVDHLSRARNYPIQTCLVQRGWDSEGLALVVVARRQPDDNLVFGAYVVDYYCTGLKQTAARGGVPAEWFQQQYLPGVFPKEPPLQISADLAHEIVYGGIEYAARLGLRPHRDFKVSQAVLDPPETHRRSGVVQFGRSGRPFYVPGPEDNAKAILQRLVKRVGPGNFDVAVGPATPEPEHSNRPEEATPQSSLLWTPGQPERPASGSQATHSGLWVPGS